MYLRMKTNDVPKQYKEDLVDKALQVGLGGGKRRQLELETMRLWDAFSNTKENYGIVHCPTPPKKSIQMKHEMCFFGKSVGYSIIL